MYMSNKIKLGIVGFGNLGKGAVKAIKATDDLELVAVFTRRDPETLKLDDSAVAALPGDNASDYQDKIDVMARCSGSATALPEQTPYPASMLNTVDSDDTDAKIPECYQMVNEVARGDNTTCLM